MINFRNSEVFRFWKILSFPIFLFVLIHFTKDITQDLLGVDTILDSFGDVNEDLSKFPEKFIWLYHWAGVNTILMQVVLLFTLPRTWKRKTFSRIDYLNGGFVLFLVMFFTVAILLDPRY